MGKNCDQEDMFHLKHDFAVWGSMMQSIVILEKFLRNIT